MNPLSSKATFEIKHHGTNPCLLLEGNWRDSRERPTVEAMESALDGALNRGVPRVSIVLQDDVVWDARLMAMLIRLHRYCRDRNSELDLNATPDAMQRLFRLATAVDNPPSRPPKPPGFLARLGEGLSHIADDVGRFLAFIGELAVAILRFVTGRSQTRIRDLFYFIDLGGPKAVGIVSLISVLVGMILAYLGSVQLRQFGAEVYVANLVGLGMVREMGPLMTAVIMAGRTGAAYAAQLGTMQSNDEVDAVTTLGLSPMEYLVVPRVLALILVMPPLVILSNSIGLGGGALVAAGMDVNFVQFINQAQDAVSLGDVLTGLVKAVVFATLIAIAGCQAGLQSGRTSAAVGDATTRAVVHAVVYLVVADAVLNILYDKLEI